MEWKVAPQIVSVEPLSDSEIAPDEVVIITFDGAPSDAKIQDISFYRRDSSEITPPQLEVNGNVLTLTRFPTGYRTYLTISWGGGGSKKRLNYVCRRR